MPLSLRGTQHGCAQGARRQMPNPSNKKTKQKRTWQTKEKYTHRQELHLAPDGGISLTCVRFSLIRKWKARVWKQKVGTCECVCVCVFSCLRVVHYSAASAPWRCLHVAKGPSVLAPNQPESCVHSALPPAAGKLVAAICHGGPHIFLSHYCSCPWGKKVDECVLFVYLFVSVLWKHIIIQK